MNERPEDSGRNRAEQRAAAVDAEGCRRYNKKAAEAVS